MSTADDRVPSLRDVLILREYLFAKTQDYKSPRSVSANGGPFKAMKLARTDKDHTFVISNDERNL